MKIEYIISHKGGRYLGRIELYS